MKKSKISQSPPAHQQQRMDAERERLLEETDKAMEWVSPSTWALMEAMRISSKKRSRDGLIKGCHMAVKRFLMYEVVIIILRLIPDIQNIIINKIRDNEFKVWYDLVVSKSYRFYEIYDLWGSQICFNDNARVGTMLVHPHDLMWTAPYVEDHYK